MNTFLGNAIANSIRNSRYTLVKDVSKCTQSGNVTTWYAPNSKKLDDAPLMGLGTIKREISERRIDGNAFSNVHMTDREFPLSKADVFKCPDEVIEEFKKKKKKTKSIYTQI